ncbi:MAG: tryptophan-rich sensory protein [Hyphomicrobiales bacterium]|nr:tryptophan-rich sensory protein [Rhodoblastus sp.]MCC2111198.1 tryptophan-rich sensory protein [Hyphomicrobiales bacterium]
MHPALAALISIALVGAAGFAGSSVTLPAIPSWYAGLTKPFFTPPNWVFGPAWTLLYILIAFAFWRILTLDRPAIGKSAAIIAFLVQIFLNGLWSFAFFGWRSPGGGLVVIACLWLAIVATIFAFAKLDRIAACLLAPYLAWVTFAAALNAGVYLSN